MSLTAPTDGATVSVSRIEVLGTIAPQNAILLVSGKRVRVRHGAFETPMSLHRGLTHIKIDARASGYEGSSTVISVRYAPPSPAQGSSPGTTGGAAGGPSMQPPASVAPSGGRQGGGDISPEARAQAISSCSNGSGGRIIFCTCVFDRLARAGFNTVAQWQALVASWRRSFLRNGVISYPPVMKNAIIGCVRG